LDSTFTGTPGGPNTRLQFFGDCTNANNDYKFYYGHPNDMALLLKDAQFKLKNSAIQDPQALYYVDQVNVNNLDNQGLLPGENPANGLVQ